MTTLPAGVLRVVKTQIVLHAATIKPTITTRSSFLTHIAVVFMTITASLGDSIRMTMGLVLRVVVRMRVQYVLRQHLVAPLPRDDYLVVCAQ
jgi:hypothetical protein